MGYKGKFTGAQIDEQISKVANGQVVIDNTDANVTEAGANPVSGAGIFKAISEAAESLKDIIPTTADIGSVVVENTLSALDETSNKPVDSKGIAEAIKAASNSLKERGYIYKGVATPTTTPDMSGGKVFYLAAQAGEYTNFGITLPTDALTSLEWDGERWYAIRIADLVTPAEVAQIILDNTASEVTADGANPVSGAAVHSNLYGITQTTIVNEGEVEYYTSFNSGYAQKGIGQMTPIVGSPTKVSTVKIGPVKSFYGSGNAQYAIVKMATTNTEGVPSSLGEVLIEGVMPLSTSFKTLDVVLNKPITLNRGERLVVYFWRSGGPIQLLGKSSTDNIAKFNDLTQPIVYTLNVDNAMKVYWYGTAVTTYAGVAPVCAYKQIGIIPEINEAIGIIDNTPEIILPKKIVGVVGDKLQIFYRGVVKTSTLNGLDIKVTCTIGKQTPRYYEVTPTASDVGTKELKIEIRNNIGVVVAEEKCELQIVKAPISPQTKKNIIILGDSLTANGEWVNELGRRLTAAGGSPSGNALANIALCGSKKTSYGGYFAAGGWVWGSYLVQGQTAFRFSVTGVNSLSIGAVYTNNGFSYTVTEVNVTDGVGNILCTTSSLANIPSTSAKLIKSSGTGDPSIEFTSAEPDATNPLWDVDNSKVSFIPYADEVADGNISAVYVLLGWNEIALGEQPLTSQSLSNITSLANTLHAEFANAKLKIIGLQINSLNGGMGANYGASGIYSDTLGMARSVLNLNKVLQNFADENSDYVEFIPLSAQFDSEYNMPSIQVGVNSRNDSTTERIGTNGVHPTNSGYMQIADAVYRNVVKEFCQ